jgi:membrane protein YqaA with SNARE-associated domain
VHHSTVPKWLTHLGALGLFAVAAIDSSVVTVPLPGSTDLLLLWLVSHHGNAWILTPSAIAGSILGGYTCWSTGKKGGEAALSRYVKERQRRRISRWVEGHAVLSVFVPALLPPPIPLLPFLLAAGALGVTRQRFLLVYSAARSVRYGIVAWLGITYGRRLVRQFSGALDKWSTPFFWAFAVVMIGFAGWAVWKVRSQRSGAAIA